MKLLSKFNVSREDGGPRRFTFELPMSGIISIVVVAVLGITWVFILGVLVGRGYKPENAVPELAQIMPTAEAPAQPVQTEEPTVLKPEELQFMENLQGKAKEGDMIVVESTQAQPGDAAPKQAPSSGSGVEGYDLDKAQAPAVQTAEPVRQLAESDMKTKKESSEAKPATKTEPKAKTAPKTVAAEPVEIAAQESPKPASKPVEVKSEGTSGGARFTATYQIASFYKKDQADTMIQKLTKNGLTPSIREAEANGKRVYRIILTVTGTDQELSDAIRKTGEKGPMLLKKKPL